MIFAYCHCGWSAFASDFPSLLGLHRCGNNEAFLKYRQFVYPHMAPDGIAFLLGEARATKEFERLTA